MQLKIPVKPMGAVRMTTRGKWVSESAKRYLSYKNQIQWEVKKQLRTNEIITGPIEVDMIFYMPIPQSWSKKKKREAAGTFHTKKPDADNLVKGVFDSLNKLVWKDDNQVCKISAKKIYAEEPGISLDIKEISA